MSRRGTLNDAALRPLGRPVRIAVVLLALVPWTLALRMEDHSDFDLYYYGARVERHGSFTDTKAILTTGAAEGAHPGHGELSGTPILVALVFVPLSFLPLHVAQRIALLACLVLVAFALRRAAGGEWWAAAFLALSVLPGFTYALALGQPSMLTLALVLLAYAALRDGHDRTGGAFVGLAAALKVYPAFLIIALIAARRWQALVSATIVMGGLALATLPVLGLHDVGPAIERTLHFGAGVATNTRTQSLPSLAAALFHASRLTTVGSVVLLLVGAAAILRLQWPTVASAFSAATLVMLAGQTLTWEHYLPLAMIGILAMPDLGAKRGPFLLAIAGYLLLAVPGQRDYSHQTTSLGVLASGVHIYAVLVLLAAVVWAAQASHPALTYTRRVTSDM